MVSYKGVKRRLGPAIWEATWFLAITAAGPETSCVRAERLDLSRTASYSRQQFKDRVEEKVGGALLEHYKAECAQANDFTRWVEHWRNEVQRLLGELQVVLLHEIRGFKDRRKAYSEVLDYLQAKDSSYRRVARGTVARDFRVKKLTHAVPASATENFYRMVQETADIALESQL